MTEELNPYRVKTIDEKAEEHLFTTYKHFPQISQSLRGVKKLQETVGKSYEINVIRRSKSVRNRRKNFKSTTALEALCKSSVSDLSPMKEFQHELIQRRLDQRKALMDKLPKSSRKPVEQTPLESANEKLTKIALKYDSRRANNDLQGFVGAPMTVKELDTQLKRGINIYLSSNELNALFSSMDSDKNGLLDPVEFLKYFFKLSHNAREKVRNTIIRDINVLMEKIRRRRDLEEERLVQDILFLLCFICL